MKAAATQAVTLSVKDDGVARIRAARNAMLARRRAAGLTVIHSPKDGINHAYRPKFKLSLGTRLCSVPTW